MKKRVGIITAILLITVLCSALYAPLSAAGSEKATEIPQSDPALAARFMNMLNHNYSYNEDFDSVDALVNNAVCALAVRSNTDDEFIPESVVADYMMDMYGIELTDASALNPEFPQKEGYLFIIPRGLTAYKHSFVSAVKNEDGSYTVKTEVTLKPHDDVSETVEAVSLFVPSRTSAFGFHLISSDIPQTGNIM